MKNFNEIYAEWYNRIYIHINVRVKSREEVEELTNDVFLKVHKHLALYDPEKSQFTTWIHVITNHVIIDYFRKKKLETTDLSMFADEEGDNVLDAVYSMSSTNTETPHSVIVRKEIAENVQNEILSLPRSIRDVARLFFNEDLSHEEISTTLDLPLGTVKGYIYRARLALQESLKPQYECV
jgi:RNA polymerase sigma-70 factor (ECF subfamily)